MASYLGGASSGPGPCGPGAESGLEVQVPFHTTLPLVPCLHLAGAAHLPCAWEDKSNLKCAGLGAVSHAKHTRRPRAVGNARAVLTLHLLPQFCK